MTRRHHKVKQSRIARGPLDVNCERPAVSSQINAGWNTRPTTADRKNGGSLRDLQPQCRCAQNARRRELQRCRQPTKGITYLDYLVRKPYGACERQCLLLRADHAVGENETSGLHFGDNIIKDLANRRPWGHPEREADASPAAKTVRQLKLSRSL